MKVLMADTNKTKTKKNPTLALTTNKQGAITFSLRLLFNKISNLLFVNCPKINLSRSLNDLAKREGDVLNVSYKGPLNPWYASDL